MHIDQKLIADLEDYYRDSPETRDPAEKDLCDRHDQAMLAWLEGGKEGLAKFLLDLEGQEPSPPGSLCRPVNLSHSGAEQTATSIDEGDVVRQGPSVDLTTISFDE